MSLNKEALKKAQTQRTEEMNAARSPAPPAAPPVAQTQVRIAKRPPPLSARTLIRLIACGLLALPALGVAGFFYFSSPATPPSALAGKPTAPVANAPHAAPGTGIAPAVRPTPGAPTEQIGAVSLSPLPAADPASLAQPNFIHSSRPNPSSRPAAPVANPKIRAFIDTLRISGVRATPSEPKVLLNGQVFRINDVVDRGLKVRLLKIEATQLVFGDANDLEYPKSY